MPDTPAYLWAITLIGMIGIPGLTSVVLYRGTRDHRRALVVGVSSAVLLGAWFALSGVIAAHGWYVAKLGTQPPWLPIAFLAALLAMLGATAIPSVARAIAAPGTLGRLHLPHAFRVAGVAFLITMALGHLPALFALPAGLGDIAVGIAAPFVARDLARGTGHRAAVRFNILGIADLVVALTLGSLTAFQIVAVTPTAQAIAELPLALIPTAAVPLLLALHITALRGLSGAGASARDVSAESGDEREPGAQDRDRAGGDRGRLAERS